MHPPAHPAPAAELAGTGAPPDEPPPAPLPPAALDDALARLDGGEAFKPVLEDLLDELAPDDADRLMQLLREGRGAWVPLLRGRGGAALFLGNALSGAVVPLALAGFDVTVVDASGARLRFGHHRTEAQLPGRARPVSRPVRHDGRGPLPFPDGAFDLVVHDATAAGGTGAHAGGEVEAEVRRVARGELVRIGDNRLGYKRSLGQRGAFHVPGPLEYAARALRPPPGERTLPGHRRAAGGAGLERGRAFALYPHSGEFALVVGLDGGPRLPVGPKERRNRLKTAARALGLFPVLTPSFAILGARRASGVPPTARVERVLDALAARLGEPRPELDQLVATRDNAAVCLTRPPGRGPAADAPGAWVLHLPLGTHQLEQIPRHAEALRLLRERAPGVPVPVLLFHGELEGLELSCERRLGGWTAPQRSGDVPRTARMLADAAQHLALLATPPAPLDADGFERLLGAKFDVVARHAREPGTLRWLAELRERLAGRLVGRPLPRALCHGDLRAKHVQLDDDGRVLGYLDWGTATEDDVPYYDLLHLLTHERKQEAGCSAGEAWRLVRGRAGLREHERAALDDHARAIGLDEDARAALEEAYPVFVACVAERNWDYSRPRWLHRQFGV